MVTDNKLQIVEFNGLPGSGKTTTASGVANKLKSLGYNVEFFERVGDYFPTSRLSLIKDFLQYNGFAFCCKMIGIARIIKPRDVKRYKLILYIFQHSVFYKKLKSINDDKIFIISQGLVQGFLSFVHIDTIVNITKLRGFLNILFKPHSNIIYVNCCVDTNEAFSRIRKRNLANGRFDAMDNACLKIALENQDKTIQIVRDNLNKYSYHKSIDIDTQDSVDENVMKILSLIEG